MRQEQEELLSHFEGSRVMITGGLGFIGSSLAFALAALGAQVTLVDSMIPEYGGNLHNIAGLQDKVKINISDVRDPYSMKYLVKSQRYLFNLAGQTSHMDSMREPFTDLEINAKAQLSILEACRHHNPEVKIVFASTRQVYGKPNYLPVDENHLVQPVDVNGVNKAAGEWYHLLYHRIHGIYTVVLRLTNTYGPRMRIKDARQTFLGIWIRRITEGEPFEIWEGDQIRDFNYVDDVIRAILMCGISEEVNGEVFNLGSEEPLTLKQLGDILVAENGAGQYKICPYPSDRKPIDIGDYYADFTKIKSFLGWSPRISMREGLKKTVEFYREHLASYL